MGERTIETLAGGGGFFEGPRWHDGRWWVSDFYRQAVFTYTPDGQEQQALEVANQPSGLGWLPDGSLLVVSMKDRRVLRWDAGSGVVEEYADLSAHAGGHLNDMVVDTNGHAWVGNFGFDLMGGGKPEAADLVRIDSDGTITVAADGLRFPNGSVITPDGGTLIVGETMGARFTAWTITDDGELTDRRLWAEVPGIGPDGCCLDAEGHIWVADGLGGDVLRVAPVGEVVERIGMPEGLNAYACMLGGDDGRTLLLCTAPDYFEHNRANAREATLLTTTVDVPHAGLP
jgi:sugar lactone lactonase YvrE